jgi:hypothetical protein
VLAGRDWEGGSRAGQGKASLRGRWGEGDGEREGEGDEPGRSLSPSAEASAASAPTLTSPSSFSSIGLSGGEYFSGGRVMRTILPMCLISTESSAPAPAVDTAGLVALSGECTVRRGLPTSPTLALLMAPKLLRRDGLGLTSRLALRSGEGETLSSSKVLPPGPPRMAFGGGPTRCFAMDDARVCPVGCRRRRCGIGASGLVPPELPLGLAPMELAPLGPGLMAPLEMGLGPKAIDSRAPCVRFGGVSGDARGNERDA